MVEGITPSSHRRGSAKPDDPTKLEHSKVFVRLPTFESKQSLTTLTTLTTHHGREHPPTRQHPRCTLLRETQAGPPRNAAKEAPPRQEHGPLPQKPPQTCISSDPSFPPSLGCPRGPNIPLRGLLSRRDRRRQHHQGFRQLHQRLHDGRSYECEYGRWDEHEEERAGVGQR